MTSVAEPTATPRVDWRVIVRSGLILGVITTVGVWLFAMLTGATSGFARTIVQSVLVLLGGVVFAFGPALLFRPRDVDTIAWASMIGLLGALFFTVFDTAILRPLDTYSWKWDAIGGGSGFWYIPVWWMGAALLAWLGAWGVAINSPGDGNVNPPIGQTLVITLVLAALLMVLGIVPFTAASAALAFSLALVIQVALSSVFRKG